MPPFVRNFASVLVGVVRILRLRFCTDIVVAGYKSDNEYIESKQ